MLGSLWGGGGADPATPAPAPGPCLLVPGLCGSVLHARGAGEAGEGRREWIVAEAADASFHALWGRYDPQGRRLESLTGEEVLVPTGGLDDGGLYGCDVLDPSLNIIPPAALRYFHTLIQTMTASWGYVPGRTLHGFPYDFRQSNLRHLELLLAKLQAVSEANGGAKVDVVSHSMGGLVVKALLARYPDECARLLRSWVAIAAPFNGAPGFVADALLSGVQFIPGWANYFFVQRETLRQMVCQAPSIFELLPSAAMDWGDGAGTPRVTLRLSGPPLDLEESPDGEDGAKGSAPVLSPVAPKAASAVGVATSEAGQRSSGTTTHTFDIADNGLRALLKLCMQDNTVTLPTGECVPLPLVDAIFEHAIEMRTLLSQASLPPGCKMLNLFGTGLATPFSCAYGTETAPLESLEHLRDGSTSVVFETLDGDGTVPAVSACRDGLAAFQRVGLQGDHRELMELPASLDLIHGFLTEVAGVAALDGDAEGAADTGNAPGAPAQHGGHFYTGMRYWPYCTEPDELPEVEGGWLVV